MSYRNYFRENRLAILRGIEQNCFLTPLSEDDLPLKISEKNKNSSLKEVTINNVPADKDGIRPRSWILDLEMSKPIFGKIENTKNVEKALIVLGSDALRVFMFELKSSLQPYNDGCLDSIKTKMEHTIARISMLLPIQIFGTEFNNFEIIYKGIICYNQDNEIIETAKKDANFARSDMYKIFNDRFDERNKTLTISDIFGRTHQIELFFFKNPNIHSSSFQIDFQELFFKEWEIESASNGDMTCPILKELPNSTLAL